mgnify:CR=1 FL=1
MGEPKIFVSYVGCVVLSGMVPFVGWRRFTKENHSSKDGKFSCLAGYILEQKSVRISSHITGKSHDNGKSSANDNQNSQTDFDTFMYNGFQKSTDHYSQLWRSKREIRFVLTSFWEALHITCFS